ncbi:MAG: bifunctional (p)ppGpp synthetase/guanosine-3',5'-bis(diphosphate) 3'-pyrophosphohydrolase [Lachnospiraceae bacterium]|nr:bifunctional (p)ppGpp synthetase/guanosine-3',5'-bis(diphosphate) 3'-pyrophosphohydrolase [Lachnospiraceae bacterium]
MGNRDLAQMRMDYPDVNNAFWYAVKAHKGQLRKDGKTPYINHPVEVAEIVCTMTDVPSVVEAALLHDTVEDTSVRINDIIRVFGIYVGDLVADETENKRRNIPAMETWRVRKEEAIRKIAGAGSEAKMISLADKLSNLRSIKRSLDQYGDDVWNWFNNNEIADQAWYYRSMRDQYIGLKTTDAWKEYAALIEVVFSTVTNQETLDTEDLDFDEGITDEYAEDIENTIDEAPLDVVRMEDEEYIL